MSQSSARSTAFLREMGVGVQWKLRHAPEADGFAEAVQALADGLPAEPVSPAPVEVRPAVPEPVAPRPASPQAAPFEAEPRPAAVPVPATPPQPAAAGEDTAWFDEAPMPPPAATPTRLATAMPPSPAAPPRAAATAPSTAANSARPAASVAPQSGGSRPPAPAASRPAPSAPARPASRSAASADPAAADEDTSWFDDAPMPTSAATPSQPAPVSDAAIAEMDWSALQAAVASCTRCTLCETRKVAVNGRGAENATWLAIAGVPSEQDEQDAQAVTGEAGQLLHNMLKAIELKPEADVYVTNVVKCRPPQRNPTAEEVIACRPFLDRELALTGATRAITFGQFAARGLMMGPAARGQVMRYQQLSVVATYHPDDLLRKPEDKAKAWADLCLAKAGHA